MNDNGFYELVITWFHGLWFKNGSWFKLNGQYLKCCFFRFFEWCFYDIPIVHKVIDSKSILCLYGTPLPSKYIIVLIKTVCGVCHFCIKTLLKSKELVW